MLHTTEVLNFQFANFKIDVNCRGLFQSLPGAGMHSHSQLLMSLRDREKAASTGAPSLPPVKVSIHFPLIHLKVKSM